MTTTLLIRGLFLTDTFPTWIIRRATKLSLSGWVKKHNNRLIEVSVGGDQILIEALEVACSLGPIDAVVDSVEKRAKSAPEQPYRQPTQFVRY